MNVLAFLLLLCVSDAADVSSQSRAATPEANEVAEAPATAGEPTLSETVVVTATRSERRVSELPQSTAVIGEEQIRTAPVRAVDDLLRGVSGVTPSVISSSGSTPNNQRFSMHGLGGTRALVLVDGIPLHDPYSGIVQWQNVPLQSLRQIEVVRGGNASLFGNFALGGTVNLLSKEIERDELSLDLSYGSWETGRGAINFDAVINPMFSLRLRHNQTDSDGYYRVPDPGAIDVPAWVENSITSARADFRLSDRSHGFVNASTSDIDTSQGTPVSYSKRDIEAFSAGFHQGVGAASLVSVSAYTQDQTERLVNSSVAADRASEFKTQDGTIDSTGSGVSLEWVSEPSSVFPLVSVGVDLQQIEATEDRISFNRSGAVTRRQEVGGDQQFAGLFVQGNWRPVGRMEILASARYDRFSNENGFDATEGGTTTLYADKSSSEFDPRISVRYAAGERSAFRGSVYRAFKAPTLRELYRSNVSGRSVILGNPDLEPETLTGGELGWEWADGNTRIEVNLYRSSIDGLLSLAATADNPNVFKYLNLGTSVSQGVELTAEVRLARRWFLGGAYTFADATITEDPNPNLEGNWVQEVPRHAGSISVRFAGDRGSRGELRARAVGDSYGDATNLALSPAHQVVDLFFSHPLWAGIEGYVIAENVFDEEYYLALAANSFRTGLPRTITAGIRIDGFKWRSR